jgi:DegV family protein with EDD domain
MTNKVAIVTDSTACISKEMARQYGIEVVPVVLLFGKEAYRDGLDMTPAEFYTRLKQSSELPRTSGSIPLVYLDAYREASRRAPNILCITISLKLSGLLNSAELARGMAGKELPGTVIEIIDSDTAAGAQGLVVLAAARAASAGKDLAEVTTIARDVMQKVYLFAMLDTLHYLVKGGRVPRVLNMATSLLQIKPIVTIRDGEAHPYTNARTTDGGLKRLVKIVERKIVKDLPLHMVVMHADAEKNARVLMQELSAKFSPDELMLNEFTPVMGVHTGPGLVGVAFYNG